MAIPTDERMQDGNKLRQEAEQQAEQIQVINLPLQQPLNSSGDDRLVVLVLQKRSHSVLDSQCLEIL
jgi:hypothetical protein